MAGTTASPGRARQASRPGGRAGSAPRATPSRTPAGTGRSADTSGGSSSGARDGGARSGGGARSSGGGSGRDGAPREPRGLTMRTVGLGLVLLVAFIVLAPTLRAYVAQQEQLRDINAQIADSQAQVEELQHEFDRWQDPEYVKSQARERFGYVLPGERVYRVIDPETVTGDGPAPTDDRGAFTASVADPWYVSVWSSVEVAGAAEQAAAGAGVDGADDPATATDDATAADGAASPADGAATP